MPEVFEVYGLSQKATPDFLNQLSKSFPDIFVAPNGDWMKIRVSYGNEEKRSALSGKIQIFLKDKNYLTES